ncbi:hypothetical protein BGX38DRAFT_1273447 [Terfezia claveryi]|nr:hypothetical protein BGX38DRAFT_1273447 [Terfezia claveryi]
MVRLIPTLLLTSTSIPPAVVTQRILYQLHQSYILPCSPPPPSLPITAGCVAVVVIVIVELPPELTLSRAAIFTSTKFKLRVASPPWMRVGLEMTSLPRVVVHSEASEIGKQQSKLGSGKGDEQGQQ